MKPRFSSLRKAAFPALIIVPAFFQPAMAGDPISDRIISPIADGSVTVTEEFTSDDDTDWTVEADSVNGSNLKVTVEEGAKLTGAPEVDNGIDVITDNYTVENSGEINVGGIGVNSRTGDTVIKNLASGKIFGGNVAILLSLPEMELDTRREAAVVAPFYQITNSGAIHGFQGGISADDGISLSLENKSGGFISGNAGPGIIASGNLSLINAGGITGGFSLNESPLDIQGSAFGSGSDGISAGDDANIENSGSIEGLGGNGISSGNGLYLDNNGFISGIAFSGGGIMESDARVPEGFSPGNFSGILTGADANITNQSDGVIEGGTNGILLIPNTGFLKRSDDEEPMMDGVPFISSITNMGTITGLGSEGYGIRSMDFSIGREIMPTFNAPETVNNYGIIAGRSAAIDLGTGADIINLFQGSTIEGDIRGGGGTLLNFIGGSTSLTSPDNVVYGDVEGIATITKSGTGYAFIGKPGDFYNVEADTINVTGGGLIINGDVDSNTGGKTIINLSGEGQLDGSGNWNADLIVGSGGISAGRTTNVLDEGQEMELFKKDSAPDSPQTNYSIGSLTIKGAVSHTLGSMAVRSSNVSLPAPDPDPISYIRVDIKPQAEMSEGVSHDIIYLTGDDSIYDLTNATILLAPTAPGLTLTDGDYTIIDGVNPLIGFSPDIPVGLLLRNFDSTTTKSGKFVSSLGSGTITYDSVLTNYFTTLRTEDPAITDLEPLGKRIAPVISLPVDTSEFDSNLVVTIVHSYENLPGLTENQSALGAAIDGLADSPDPLIQEFIANLDISNLATVQDTLTLLDPSSSFGLVSSQVNTNYRLHRITENHLAGIRGSSTQTSSVAPSSKDAKGSIVAGPSSTLTSGRGNAWGSFSYDDQDYDGSLGGSDYDGDTGSFTAGVDWLVAPDLVVGVVFDGSKSDYNGEGYDSEVDSFRGAVYGTWGNAMGFYSDALIGFGTADFESHLGSSGILTGNVSNDTSADSFQALWTAGYAMGTQHLKHGPFAGFEYQTLSVDGYSQGGPLDIKVDDYDVDSLRALIGYRVDADLGKFSPYASVAYAHEFEDGENTTTATVGGAPFEVAGAEQGSAILLSVGTSVALTKSLSLDVSYRGEIALDDGISSNGVSLGLNYNF